MALAREYSNNLCPGVPLEAPSTRSAWSILRSLALRLTQGWHSNHVVSELQDLSDSGLRDIGVEGHRRSAAFDAEIEKLKRQQANWY